MTSLFSNSFIPTSLRTFKAICFVFLGKEFKIPFFPVTIVISRFFFVLLKRFLRAKANSTEPAPPPIKAIELKFLISFKKLLANFEIGLTGTQFFCAPLIFL